MAGMEGMDPDVVEGLGNQLKNQENSIQSIVSAVDGIINQIEGSWRGNDATEFMGWWQQQHKPALVAAATAIGGLGTSAQNNAAAQRATSAS
jgi:WXG100 family type VII secretion target